MSKRPLRIGLSARIYHPQAGAKGLQSKSLQYLEQSVAHWVMSRDVMVFMIPSVSGDGIVYRSNIRLSDYAEYLDGLVLQGGADISPQCYGEEPLHPDWAGDRVRDAYEMELLHEFMESGKALHNLRVGEPQIALVSALFKTVIPPQSYMYIPNDQLVECVSAAQAVLAPCGHPPLDVELLLAHRQ